MKNAKFLLFGLLALFLAFSNLSLAAPRPKDPVPVESKAVFKSAVVDLFSPVVLVENVKVESAAIIGTYKYHEKCYVEKNQKPYFQSPVNFIAKERIEKPPMQGNYADRYLQLKNTIYKSEAIKDSILTKPIYCKTDKAFFKRE